MLFILKDHNDFRININVEGRVPKSSFMNAMHDGKEGGDRVNLVFGLIVIPEFNLLYLKYLRENDYDLDVDWYDW
jgi:hypothetical protein